jgi:ADP-ribose pyrophosphatase
LEKGENPIVAAARELEEEAGVKAQDFELLYVCYPTPGYTNEKIYIYRARGGEKVSAHLDEDEFLEAAYIPVEQVKEMLKNGEIRDAKTIIALQAYFLSEK